MVRKMSLIPFQEKMSRTVMIFKEEIKAGSRLVKTNFQIFILLLMKERVVDRSKCELMMVL